MPKDMIAHAIIMQIKDKGYHAGHNEEFDTYIFDEASEDRVSGAQLPACVEMPQNTTICAAALG